MANSIAYGTITISDLSDGAQIWTTTVAPTTPDYTFTKTDLNTDGSVDIKVGDLIFYDAYRYTVTSIGETTVLGSYRTNMRGTGIWKITTAPTTPSATVQGAYPDAVYVIKRTTAISESGANEILVGDILEYDTYHYQVLHNDSSSSYIILGERVNFKGNDGISVVSVTSSNNQDDGGTSTITVRYSDGNTDVFYVKNGNAGTSSEWYYGTDLVHVSGTETLETSRTSGVTTGSMYLNTDTSLVYKCTAISQDGTLATWTYAGDLKTGILENIDVGGTNLWSVNSATFGYLTTTSGAWTVSDGVNHIASQMRKYIATTAGEEFVYQHWNPTLINDETNYGRASFYNSEKTYIGRYDFPKALASDGDHVVKHFTAPANAAYVRFCTVYANGLYDFRVKIERGNVPTSYSPAPEDLLAEAAGTSSPNLCLHTKKPTANDIVSTNDTVVIVGDEGTITLAPTSANCYFKWKSYVGDGITYQECNNKEYYLSFDAKYGTSETYTTKGLLSAYLGINVASRFETYLLSNSHDRYRAQNTYVSDDWQRYRCSFNIPATFGTGKTAALVDDNILVVEFGMQSAQVPILIKNIKLEVGDLSTEYAQAQEDIEADIANAANDANTAIDEAKIAQRAVNDLTTETVEPLVLDVTDLKNNKADNDTVNGMLKNIKANATAAKNVNDALEIYKNYIGGYLNIDDNGIIDLGKRYGVEQGERVFHLKLEGDRLVFYDGDSPMAYFYNTQLFVDDSVFNTRVKIGNFAFINRTSGNLSLMYVGSEQGVNS